jgi:hypothetical protein
MVAPYANNVGGTTGTGDIMPVTNTLGNLHREFRRRTKTQASFGTENAALIILYGLVAFGRIQPRKIDGHQQLSSFIAKEWKKSREEVESSTVQQVVTPSLVISTVTER